MWCWRLAQARCVARCNVEPSCLGSGAHSPPLAAGRGRASIPGTGPGDTSRGCRRSRCCGPCTASTGPSAAADMAAVAAGDKSASLRKYATRYGFAAPVRHSSTGGFHLHPPSQSPFASLPAGTGNLTMKLLERAKKVGSCRADRQMRGTLGMQSMLPGLLPSLAFRGGELHPRLVCAWRMDITRCAPYPRLA